MLIIAFPNGSLNTFFSDNDALVERKKGVDTLVLKIAVLTEQRKISYMCPNQLILLRTMSKVDCRLCFLLVVVYCLAIVYI